MNPQGYKSHVHTDLLIVNDGQEAMDYLLNQGEFADPETSPGPDLETVCRIYRGTRFVEHVAHPFLLCEHISCGRSRQDVAHLSKGVTDVHSRSIDIVFADMFVMRRASHLRHGHTAAHLAEQLDVAPQILRSTTPAQL